jgi:hypothetical protein
MGVATEKGGFSGLSTKLDTDGQQKHKGLAFLKNAFFL